MELSCRIKQTLEELAKKTAELTRQTEELEAQAQAATAESISMTANFERMKASMGVIEIGMWMEMHSELVSKSAEILASLQRNILEKAQLRERCDECLAEWKRQAKDAEAAASGDSAGDNE